MYFYQLLVEIKSDKYDEFTESLITLSKVLRKVTDCHDFSFYRNVEFDNSYSVVCQWKTRKAIEKHYKGKEFTVLIGAARVLGENLEIKIGEEFSEKGGLVFAKEKISL